MRWFMRLNTPHAASLISLLIAAVAYSLSFDRMDKSGTSEFAVSFVAALFASAAVVFGLAGFGEAISTLAMGLVLVSLEVADFLDHTGSVTPGGPFIGLAIGIALVAFGIARMIRAARLRRIGRANAINSPKK